MAPKRALNFSVSEERTLLSVVKQHKNKIECKQTDTNSNKIKATAWITVASEFNSLSGESFRDVKVLKAKYENLKKRSKQKFADEKSYLKGTGGGPPGNILINDVDKAMIEIAGPQITGRVSEFDGDAEEESLTRNVVDPENSEEIDLDGEHEEDEDAITPSTSQNVGWGKYTPDMLRNPISKPLQHKKKGTPVTTPAAKLKHSLNVWANSKAKGSEVEAKLKEKEFNVKLQMMKEEHEQKMKHREELHQETMEMGQIQKDLARLQKKILEKQLNESK